MLPHSVPMRILLTNDDGINARGLRLLEAVARKLSDDIWIVAPAEEQSAAGHSLTLTTPVRLRRHDERRFSVTGTPTDAVMLALAHIMKDSPPDVVMSGINRSSITTGATRSRACDIPRTHRAWAISLPPISVCERSPQRAPCQA